MNRKISIVCCVGVVCVLLYCVYSFLNFGAVILPLSTTCTIGVNGTAANVTLSGMGASRVCDQARAQNTQLYLMSEAPQGTEMCEGDVQSDRITLHYIVRDTGLLNLVGSFACAKLHSGNANFSAVEPTSTPTPTPESITNSVSNKTTISDPSTVLDYNQVYNAATVLPCHVDIYTVGNYQGINADFDQWAKGKIQDSQNLVIAFNPHHIAIVGGPYLSLSNAQYNNAVNAFGTNMNANRNYTTATLAAIQSLKNSFALTNAR